jgi:hypothetical protein
MFSLAGARDVWDWELALHYVDQTLKAEQKNTAVDFTDADGQRVIDGLIPFLAARALDYWVVVPLRDSYNRSSIRGNGFSIMSGEREKKVKKLATLAGVPLREMMDRARHTERSRSDGFFERPLLVLPLRHHQDWVKMNANRLALWAISCLRAVHSAGNEPKRKGSLPLGEPFCPGSAEHILLHAKDQSAWGHSPLRFDITAPRNLEWLALKRYRTSYESLLEEFVYLKRGSSPLHNRFLRSLRFLAKAEDAYRRREQYEGLGQALMYLMIALESLLLRDQREIRIKLSTCLSALPTSRCYQRKVVAKATDLAYRWRSDFVHDGNEVFPTYDEDWNDGPELSAFKTLKHVTARLLVDGPKTLARVRAEASTARKSEEDIWFAELKEIWEKRIGLQ